MPLSATCLQKGDEEIYQRLHGWGVEYLPGQYTHNLVGNFTYIYVLYVYCTVYYI